MLSRDSSIVFALLAALSMLLVPLPAMHGQGAAWANDDSHCLSSGQKEKGSTGGGGICAHCCTVAFAGALPAPSFETSEPALRFAVVQFLSATMQSADDAATLRPRVRAPPFYS